MFRFTTTLRVLLLSACVAPSIHAESGPSTAQAKAPETPNQVQAATKSDYSPAELEFWKAMLLLQSSEPAKREQGTTLLKKLSDDENTQAQVMLGNYYLSGTPNLKKNERKALNLFRLAAERGNGFAMVTYAQGLYSGTGVSKDRKTAVVWLQRALSTPSAFVQKAPPPEYFEKREDAPEVAGDIRVDYAKATLSTAHYLMSRILRDQGKEEEAHGHALQAAEADGTNFGVYEAAVDAALDFAFARGAARDMDKANHFIDLSKQLKKRSALQMIHNFTAAKYIDEFAMGDLEEETNKEAENKGIQIQAGIAKSMLDKKSKWYDPVSAEKWFLLAAENGSPATQLSLANHYAKGDFGKANPAEAYRWYSKIGDKMFEAVANRAIALQNGLGTTKDVDAAATLFASFKDKEIVCYLGSKGKCPTDFVDSNDIQVLYDTWAKTKEDPHAQAILGQRLLFGWGVKQDKVEARKWFKKASKKNDPLGMAQAAIIDLSEIHVLDIESARPHIARIKAAAAAGSPEAASTLGIYLTSGWYVKPDLELAAFYFEQAVQASPEDKDLLNNLAVCYKARMQEALQHSETTEAMDYLKKAIELWQKAGNNPTANYNLGMVYIQGGDFIPAGLIQKDNTKAFGYFQISAEGGNTQANRVLGQLHLRGIGVASTPSEAAYHYRIAALDGDPESLEALIDLYMTGVGVSQDFERALFWINRLIAQDRVSGLLLASDALLQKGEYKQALDLLQKLEDSTNSSISSFAKYRLFRCYNEGLGVKKNDTKAKRYLKEALDDNGDDAHLYLARELVKAKKYSEAVEALKYARYHLPKAQVLLARLYMKGLGVEKDPDQAIKLLAEAIVKNDGEAYFDLAYASYKKLEDAPSLGEAIEFADMASKRGVPAGEKLREALEKRRDKEEEPEVEDRVDLVL